PSADFVARCAGWGYQIAGHSGYLAERGLVQVATMGALRRADVTGFLDRLERDRAGRAELAGAGGVWPKAAGWNRMDEPLRLPPEKPVREALIHAGGDIDKCSVSLRLFGEDLDPGEVTKALGARPTDSCRNGDIFRGKIYDRVEKRGKWLLSLK